MWWAAAYTEPVSLPPADLVRPGAVAESLTHNTLNAVTAGIWRIADGGASAILKLIQPRRDDAPGHWQSGHEPGHWNYWRREELAYRSGLADTCYRNAGIRAPRLLSVSERDDGSVAMWLEDVVGVPGPRIAPEQLGDVAYRLGRAHATWVGRSPGHDWLSRDWLRSYTLSRPVTEPLGWDHPLAVQAWPARLRADLAALWERRHDVLAATDRLPQTLCHHDVWPMNLVLQDAGPVLLDWAFVGTGPIGEDAANLVLDSFFDGLIDPGGVDEVVAAVLDGYEQALAGVLPPAEIRRAVRLTGAAKYFWLAPRMLSVAVHGPAPVAAPSYDTRTPAAMFAGRRPPLELVAAWFRLALPELATR